MLKILPISQISCMNKHFTDGIGDEQSIKVIPDLWDGGSQLTVMKCQGQSRRKLFRAVSLLYIHGPNTMVYTTHITVFFLA